MTKDIWMSLTQDGKKEEVAKVLQQLHDIDFGKHNLTGKEEQGKLCQVKKDLEAFVIQTLKWEIGEVENE